MANVKDSLNSAMTLSGSIAAALVDLDSGMALGTVGGGADFNIDVAAAANTEVVRAKMNAMEMLGLNTGIEDILITLGTQYHIVRPITTGGSVLFLYLALDKGKANLALARHKVNEIVGALKI